MMVSENLGHTRVPNGTQSRQAVMWAKLKRMGFKGVWTILSYLFVPAPASRAQMSDDILMEERKLPVLWSISYGDAQHIVQQDCTGSHGMHNRMEGAAAWSAHSAATEAKCHKFYCLRQCTSKRG